MQQGKIAHQTRACKPIGYANVLSFGMGAVRDRLQVEESRFPFLRAAPELESWRGLGPQTLKAMYTLDHYSEVSKELHGLLLTAVLECPLKGNCLNFTRDAGQI